MGEVRPQDIGETPTLEVIVYRGGGVVHRELCETESDAAAVVATWEETVGVECVVEDLSARQLGLEAFEVDPMDEVDAYPQAGAE